MSTAVAVPKIPPGYNSWPVVRPDGVKTRVVTVDVAATLVGKSVRTVRDWITSGAVETTRTPKGQQMVLVDSLWAMVPEEFDRP